MAWTKAKDISQYQGNWHDTGEPIVLIKMSGGDDGLYMDSNAASNYESAVKAGKAVGGYHFGGGVLSSAAEAAYFLKAMSPVAENDVYALDVEAHLATRPDVVAWVQGFVNYVHDHIGVWPLVYMNLSTLQAHDWSPVLKNCGLWLADWAVSPDANIPTHYSYVMQQYSDGPNYDHDAFFGTVDQFKKYGYHKPTAPVVVEPKPITPAPAPAPAEAKPEPQPVIPPSVSIPDDQIPVADNQPAPEPITEPAPQAPPLPEPAPDSPQTIEQANPQTPPPTSQVKQTSQWGWLLPFILKVLKFLKLKKG